MNASFKVLTAMVCLLVLWLLAAPFAGAQPQAERLSTLNACSYTGRPSPAEVLTFASDDEAKNAVQRIVDASGLVQNFEIRAAGVSNAAAALDGGKRFLLYSQTFMRDLELKTGSQWAALSVMAHEVGHHLNNHTLEPKRDPKFEIEADYFSGFVLERMGADLDDAQVALNYLPSSEGSATHPPKHDRLAAVANGWTKACQGDSGCGRHEAGPESVPSSERSRPRPVRSDADSCEYARDGECDEPDLCATGTDTTDCKEQRERGPNSCRYANDGTCDEPDLCSRGTDTADCKQPNRTRLYCCDGWGNRWCQLLQPGPLGTPCYCVGVVGTGAICR